MTKEEIAVLGHAFFEGKTVQFKDKNAAIWADWENWVSDYCPKFNDGFNVWRIKPDEPKTITICTFYSNYGRIRRCVKDSDGFNDLNSYMTWTHIKSLDQVVEVE